MDLFPTDRLNAPAHWTKIRFQKGQPPFGIGSTLAIIGPLVWLVGLVGSQQVTVAQVPERERIVLAAEMRTLGDSLQGDLLPDLVVAKQDVLRATEAVRQYFAIRATPDNRDAWLRYLDWDRLVAAINTAGDQPRELAALGREALDVQQRLIGLAPGLELPALRQLRASLGKLVSAIRYHDETRSFPIIINQLNTVADRIDALDGIPSPDDEAAINAVIATLQDSAQLPATVARLRNLFAQPNLNLWISEATVQQVVQRPVYETSPVNDCILGTRIVGNATMHGTVTADLLPSIGAVRMRVQLAGHVDTINRGYNGPVVLRTSGAAGVTATRELMLDESGVRFLPTHATAQLQTHIHRIDHHLGLVRRIARKKAAQQKPQADSIAQAKMQTRVAEQFSRQTSQTAAVQPPGFLHDARPILQRLDLTEPNRVWGSTDQSLFVQATYRRSDQIAAAVPAPVLTVPYAAAIQVHESLVNNAASSIFAGRTMNERKLNELLSRLYQGLPASQLRRSQGSADDEELPFEIDFASIRPIIFEARDQRLRVGVRGTRFAQGRRAIDRPMEITAVYQPATTLAGRVSLLREGEVKVDFPGRSRLSVAEAGLRGTIKKKFAQVFPDLLLDQPLQVPDNVKVDALRGRSYHPAAILVENGWLSLAVR